MSNQQNTATTGYRDAATVLAEWDRLDEIARNTRCDIDGCTGRDHEDGVAPAEWTHTVVDEKFDNGIIEVSISGDASGFIGDICFAGSGEMTAAELRQAADEYEAFPAWLRAHADKLDALNKGV